MARIEPDVRVFQDAYAAAHAAADLLVSASADAIRQRGRFLLCLSGGQTPEALFGLLPQSPIRDLIEWEHVHVFWADERCVPTEDLDSNYKRAHEQFLSKVPLPPENIHRVRTELEPQLAADDYSLTLRRYADEPLAWPRFDVVLLGLGEDGHTASLFPGSPLQMSDGAAAVTAPEGVVVRERVTLTPGVLNAARCVVFLVHGAAKARVVASILHGEHQPEALPAQRIQPDGGSLIWLLDAAAGAGAAPRGD